MNRGKNILQKRAFLTGAMFAVVSSIIISTLYFSGENTSYAMFDEASAIHILPEEIGETTLAVGTHLIHLDTADDTIYKIAAESAEQSGQTEMYYKSELGGGAWYCLDSAQSLEDITESAVKVEDSEIAELLFTHHTRADGITYDLRTEEPVNIFDLTDPYSLNKLPEFDELANRMQIMENGGADTSLIEEFFDRDIRDEQTARLDGMLETLDRSYRNIISQEGAGTRTEMLRQVMGKVDAERRGLVYEKTVSPLNDLISMAASGNRTEDGSELLTVIGNTLKKVQARLDALADEGINSSDVLSSLTSVEDELAEEVLRAAENRDEDSLKSILSEMAALDSIRSGIGTDKEAEKKLLAERLIPEAKRLADGNESSMAEKELEYYEELSAKLAEEWNEKDLSETQKELETLYNERTQTMTKRLAALDREDSEGAKEQDTVLEEISARIRRLERDQTNGGSGSQEMQDSNAQEMPDMEESVKEAVEAIEGASLDGKDKKEQAAALIGISLFCSQEKSGVCGLLKEKAEEAAKEEGSFVFRSLTENGSSYAPADVIAELKSLRYVWRDSRIQAVLSDRDSFFCFTALSDEVNMEGDKSEQMECAALFRSVIYLPGEYVKETFECDIYPLNGTKYSVLAEKDTQETAEKVCESIRAEVWKLNIQ